MHLEKRLWTSATGWKRRTPALDGPAHLVLVFGAREALERPDLIDKLRKEHPEAHILGCSTAGEICGTRVTDGAIVATALRFDATELKAAKVSLTETGSHDAGRRLARGLDPAGLRHVLVLSDGLSVNGTQLVEGLREALPADVAVTGGLAGDGSGFKRTLVLLDAAPEERLIAAVGFYGTRLKIGYGSLGGWDPFGPERRVSRSKGNVLYDLDGHSALSLYKTYLGDHAAGLPAAGLLFPLSIREGSRDAVVRTLLSVNEADGSVTYAGDVPQGATARFMKANFDRLIDGATGAAQATTTRLGGAKAEFALLISCVGRKLVLRQRIEDEVEGVREVLGADTLLAGFYSYGEICPFGVSPRCELHNQTMTITTFSES